MQKIEPKNHINYVDYIDKSGCGKVYPRSIAESIQTGDIFINSCGNNRSVLYWHYSGFAFLYGVCDEHFLEDIYNFMSDKSNTAQRRFILFVNNESAERFFRAKNDVVIERRYFFEYSKDYPVIEAALPSGYKLCEIDKELLEKIKGKVTPSFSWDNYESFIEKGKGYCITDGDIAAAWAFSAAVSSDEIDIGIETDVRYRNHGFAYIAAQKMIQYCLNLHKTPIWACHSGNTASVNLAIKSGFTKVSECYTVRINDSVIYAKEQSK